MRKERRKRKERRDNKLIKKEGIGLT